ncbi:hypothetical protein HXA31_17215 [Salipaludibacillus agaradhaerens]|jgi:hypothetical protein|uniref:Yip1 domain-containing protein n=1 Tax=Salipaludibacillus agaradhaerens TaxID=76935 RepID=A0A9Q4B4Q4_SALAG|nr:hypothetical protein [Salipaludibacillus agaradhaerens]MCR6098289.1 hypothetical protein [Salipaludibacillus agaradhaerens]MCR6116081.1 hypothetical protein [Salipaludibacillus agaradhaerens]
MFQYSLKKLKFVLVGIFLNFLIFIMSIAQELNSIANQHIEVDPIIIHTMIIFIGVLNLLSLLIGLILVSLLAYFIGKILDSDTGKLKFFFIVSTTVFVTSLINLPLSIMNFLSTSNEIYLPTHNIILILFNPFLILGIYVLYNLLLETKLTKKAILTYCITYYLFQLSANFFSRWILGLQ